MGKCFLQRFLDTYLAAGCALSASLLLMLVLQMRLGAEEQLGPEQLKRRNVRIAQLITGLTDNREQMHEQALRGLVLIGAPVIPDLRLLVDDENPKLRLRVALVLAQINTAEAESLLLTISADPVSAVREVAALGLGRKSGDAVLRRLAVLLHDEVAAVRESAALGIAYVDDGRGIRLLAQAYVAEQVPAHALPEVELAVRRARSAQFKSLRSLAIRPQHIAAVSRYLEQLNGPALQALLEVSWEIGDPRLCLPLLKVLDRDIDLTNLNYAAKSLSANGDSRCLQRLCAIASGGIEGPRLEAAKTLSILTGHQAGPGQGWNLWLRDHQALLERMHQRDVLVARLHDPENTVSAAELQEFSPEELEMLISGILGGGSAYWPELAWHALQKDDTSRWTDYLLARHAQEYNEVRRIGLLLIVYRLGDPKAFTLLAERYQQMNQRMKKAADQGALDQAYNSERLVLALFAHK